VLTRASERLASRGHGIARAAELDTLRLMTFMATPWGGRQIERESVAQLFDLGGLADPVAEVEELGAAHVTPGDPFDLGDDR
jgi:hypothetical protein